jgi:very-short-patch-repair endonuclease
MSKAAKLTGYFAEQIAAAQDPPRPREVAEQLGERGTRDKTDLTESFLGYWNLVADKSLPVPVREHRFCKRLWRLDLAWPALKVGCEFHGGNWVHGGHARGKQQNSDYEKLNAAQELGWLILQFSTDHVAKKRVMETIATVTNVLRYRLATNEEGQP